MTRPRASSLLFKLWTLLCGLVLLVVLLDLLLDPANERGGGEEVLNDILAGAVGAAFSLAAVLFLSRHVVRPLRTLADAAGSISAGDLGHRIAVDRRDELGQLAQAFNAMADRLQAAHAALNETNARLEAEVADRTRALAAANDRLQGELARRRETEGALRVAKEAAESANRTKTLFLANMSHELRTPLHAIIGFSEILENQLFGPLGSDRYRDYVGDIRQSGVHLLRLINEILDVSKIEAGAFDLDEEVFELPAIVETCLQLVDRRARAQGVRLRQEVAARLPRLRADEVRVKQILVNLLDNAIRFTPEGGLVSVEAGPRPDGAVAIAVADTGIGIAPEELPKVLSVFGQADSSFTRRHDGAGLGLPLAKVLAEKHGGALSIDSAPGAGTRVTVTFPAERTLPAAPRSASANGQ